MPKGIDKAKWQEALTHPDWYLRLRKEARRLAREKDPVTRSRLKSVTYSLIEDALKKNQIVLAERGDNLDIEREPIDRAVIHHTSNPPGMTLSRLNAIQLLRIYGGYYANPTDPRERHFKGMPVWSGHFYKGQQVFWGYHWFIRNDGTAEQILDDAYIGWHAGNWEVNKRSVGICIDDDLIQSEPSAVVLAAIARVLSEHYPFVAPEGIMGHREANPRTDCPGDMFLPSWKATLQEELRKLG